MQKLTSLVMVLILLGTSALLVLKHRQAATPMPEGPTPVRTTSPEDAPAPQPAPQEPAAASPGAKNQSLSLPWAHEGSDIAPDQNAVFGRLDNGMRYLIYPNAEPPGKVSVRLHIRAGSLMEADDQRGIAHFLEHMMFNGSRNYKADELVPIMQRLGIAFGAHANAYTSFDETVYMLDLPDLSEQTLGLTFTVMRDFADGALLSADEIEKERGVILSEKLSRDSVNFRLMEEKYSQLLPGSLVPSRFPIGTEDVIKNAPRERFIDFYSRYYIPERMTFVVVGDIDPAMISKRIEDTFSSMTNPQQPGADPDLGKITLPTGIQTAVFQDPEVSSTELSLLLVRPYVERPDNRKHRAEDLRLHMAQAMLDRRFERIVRQPDSPITEGSGYKANLFRACQLGEISVTATNDDWLKAIPVLEQELRRALEYGFQLPELEEIKANLLSSAQRAVEEKPSRKSEDLATGIARSFNDGEILTSPETDLEILEAQLAEIDPAACHEAFRAFWQANGYHLALTTKQAPAGVRDTLKLAWEASAKQPIEAPAARAVQVFDYTDFGTPGKVVDETRVEDLDIIQLRFSNHIRVNLKRTDFEKGRIRLLARIGSGQLSQPANKPMFESFAQSVYDGGGLGKHSVDDLKRILAGKTVGCSLVIDEDAFQLHGSTTPQDFLTQCQLMCAGLIDPGFREEALWQFRKAIPQIEQTLKHTPEGPMRQMRSWLHGGDARFSPADARQLNSYTLEDARKWLGPELAKGYLELSIVGDFEPEAILPDLLATFGALPDRATKAPLLSAAREIEFPRSPAQKQLSYASKVPQGIAVTIWKTLPRRGNQRDFRRLNILAEILGDRQREVIREKLGAAYSPDVRAGGSEALEGIGYLMSRSIGKPEDLPLLQQTASELADKLADEGATADEFKRAITPLLGMLEKSQRDNDYWLEMVLSRCQQDPQWLELARHRDADYRSITLEQINTLAAKYLTKKNTLSISIQSE